MRRANRPIEVKGPVGDLARKLGSMEALAKTLGCGTRMLRNAAKDGRMPAGDIGVRLYALCKAHEVEVPAPTRMVPVWD